MNLGQCHANDILWLDDKRFVIKKMSVEPFWVLQESPVKEDSRFGEEE